MECACVYIENEGGPEFIKETTPVARKEHICSECRKKIQIKEKYERAEGVWDGDFRTYKTCLDCRSVRSEFFCNGWTYEQIWNDLHEFISDCGGDPGDDRLSKLTPAALVKVDSILKRYNDQHEETYT